MDVDKFYEVMNGGVDLFLMLGEKDGECIWCYGMVLCLWKKNIFVVGKCVEYDG